MASKKLKSNFKTLFRTGSLEETTNSASLAEAERRIKFLEKENQELREEIVDVKAMYIQLTRESSQEKYDERRVNFLKAQMIQLERQILLLNEALGGRMAVLLEAENALQTIVECCRQYEKQGDRIGETHISKEDLNVIVQTAESAKIKLYKNIENTTMLRLHKPLKFMEKFIKQSHMEQSTLLDVCSGEIEHLNLKQVAKLESQLSQIYTQLLCVNQCLAVQVFPESFQTSEPHSQIGPQVPKANFIKLFGQVTPTSRCQLDFSHLLDGTLVQLFCVLVLVVVCLSQPLTLHKQLSHYQDDLQLSEEKRKFASVAQENDYLLSLKELDMVDLCFVGCRICFEKDGGLMMACVNDLCMQSVISGKPAEDDLWEKMCPILKF